MPTTQIRRHLSFYELMFSARR